MVTTDYICQMIRWICSCQRNSIYFVNPFIFCYTRKQLLLKAPRGSNIPFTINLFADKGACFRKTGTILLYIPETNHYASNYKKDIFTIHSRSPAHLFFLLVLQKSSNS